MLVIHKGTHLSTTCERAQIAFSKVHHAGQLGARRRHPSPRYLFKTRAHDDEIANCPEPTEIGDLRVER